MNTVTPDGIIYHLDLYRLKDEEEAIKAGVEDCLYSGEICLVEWPDRAPGIFPDNTLGIFLERLDENTRKITAIQLLEKIQDKIVIFTSTICSPSGVKAPYHVATQ